MIIACDTSSVICSVAVVDNGQVLFEREATGGQIHIEKLSPFLKEALSFCQQKGTEIDGLAVAIGPGSFNGLRIGLATMKALAVSLELPLIPVPTTDAMAFSIQNSLNGLVRVVIYSHRNFVHYADYTLTPGEKIITPAFSYLTWDQLFDLNVNHFLGKSDRGFQEWLATEAGQLVSEKFVEIDASAASVGLLAESRTEAGLTELDQLEPLYNVSYEAKKWVAPQF